MNKNDLDREALMAVSDAIEKITEMIKSKGEQPSVALATGYLSMMAVRIFDTLSEEGMLE